MLLNKLELTSHNPEQSLSIADNINGHGLWESNDKCQYDIVFKNCPSKQISDSCFDLRAEEQEIPYKTFRGHHDGVTCCQFCMNDKFILSGSNDGNTQLWNSSTGVVIHTYASHSSSVSKCKISPDETKLLSSSWDKTLCFYDVETGNVLWRSKNDGIVMSCDLSSDGKLAVSCVDFEDSLKFFDTRTGSLVQHITDHHRNTPTCCTFSSNGRRIASSGMDQTTKVWDLVSKKSTITLSGHSNIVSSCCFSDNERFLATASWDKTLQVWDISTGMFRSQGATVFDRGHDGSVSSCKFSQNGRFLLSGGYDNAIVIWDMNTRTKKMALKGHEDWVNGVDISRDAKWILSCSKDKTIRVWNIESADNLPVVIENKKALGLNIVQCEKCSKPFSLAQADDSIPFTWCVFCRLADPERNSLPEI